MTDTQTGAALLISGVRGVAFDLDDTLCLERAYAFSGFEAVGEWLKERVPCSIDPAARLKELFDSADRRRLFDRLLAEIECPEPARLIPEMVACYRGHTPCIALLPDAARALRRWRGRFRLGLIADGMLSVQRLKIDVLGLAALLDPVILTDAWGTAFWKPHPRAFEEVQAAWQLPPSQCVYIADNPAKDFLAPRQLGWRTICLHRPDGVYCEIQPPPGGESDYNVTCLDDLELAS